MIPNDELSAKLRKHLVALGEFFSSIQVFAVRNLEAAADQE